MLLISFYMIAPLFLRMSFKEIYGQNKEQTALSFN